MPGSVSIVVPTRNRGRLLVEAVRSAVAVSPHEVIVVDARSTDGSPEAVEALPGVRVLRGEYSNAAASRNAGAAVATGDQLGFLDSDDLLLAGKTTCLVEELDARPDAALVHGATTAVNEAGEPLPGETAAQHAAFANGERLGTSYPALAEFCAMFTSATLIRRSAFAAVGGYDETLDAYEDWDLYLRLSCRWRLVYALDCEAAYYRIWPGNVGWRRTAEWTARVARKHLAELPPLEPEEHNRTRYALLRRVAFSQHILVCRSEARSAALAALRLDPRRAVSDREVRGPLLRSFAPARVVRARRPGGDWS